MFNLKYVVEVRNHYINPEDKTVNLWVYDEFIHEDHLVMFGCKTAFHPCWYNGKKSIIEQIPSLVKELYKELTDIATDRLCNKMTNEMLTNYATRKLEEHIKDPYDAAEHVSMIP